MNTLGVNQKDLEEKRRQVIPGWYNHPPGTVANRLT
jgi:hypothetical protein